jgi:hypothetical protein
MPPFAANTASATTMLSHAVWSVPSSVSAGTEFATAADCHIWRLRFGIQLVNLLNLPNLTQRLVESYPEIEPDEAQLSMVCEMPIMRIHRPRMLELA